MFCPVCGYVDEHYDEISNSMHFGTTKHQCNVILAHFIANKRSFSKNKDGIFIYCSAETEPIGDAPINKVASCDHYKIRIYAKPSQTVKFLFTMHSELKNEDIHIIGLQLAHPQPQFKLYNEHFQYGLEPHILKRKSTIENEIRVEFMAADIGQYEMPIMFTFHRVRDDKNIIFFREMVVMVQEETEMHPFQKSPYTNEDFGRSIEFVQCTERIPYEEAYKIPKSLKTILPLGLSEDSLNKLNCDFDTRNELRAVLIATRSIFDEGLCEQNYRIYFHHLLWWEETITRINLRKYNMAGVRIELRNGLTYWLEVPGLAEKRPSLLRGDRVLVRAQKNNGVLYEAVIGNVNDNYIQLSKLDARFGSQYTNETLYNIRFMMCRVPYERMHIAVQCAFDNKHGSRIFPKPEATRQSLKRISKFYNKMIADNVEQRSAVEHIVSKTCGKVPYIVFGPPGTGKTMTIVEAIVQVIVRQPRNRVLVCTDSNMAADHIALMLLKYSKVLNINNFIFRANSQNREWSIMPPELIPVSNGSSYTNFCRVNNDQVSMYRILVTTLLHSAKYGRYMNQDNPTKLKITHLFIDEAAQAREPAALVPITGLLSSKGQLVLAGDPQQLGPVCLSLEAKEKGLGVSLLERLWASYKNIYENDSNYITTLVQNYRSDPAILHIPNQLFYKDNPLQARAKPDPLTSVSILGLPGGNQAVVFHSVNSREQRMGITPSYFNEKELTMLQMYMKALTQTHHISPKEIGIIAPYIRQVYKMRDWLKQNNFDEVEIGTVESFQGKEKRVILVSTVRANCRLLDYDARYNLGFLTDDKRFNVAVTRAKAKLVIIGNPSCLNRDIKWRMLMNYCKINHCYFGGASEQLERTSSILVDIARTRFDRCRLTEALALAVEDYQKKNHHYEDDGDE